MSHLNELQQQAGTGAVEQPRSHGVRWTGGYSTETDTASEPVSAPDPEPVETESAAPMRRQALPLRERQFLERLDGGQIIRQAAIAEGLSLMQGKRLARENGLK